MSHATTGAVRRNQSEIQPWVLTAIVFLWSAQREKYVVSLWELLSEAATLLFRTWALPWACLCDLLSKRQVVKFGAVKFGLAKACFFSNFFWIIQILLYLYDFEWNFFFKRARIWNIWWPRRPLICPRQGTPSLKSVPDVQVDLAGASSSILSVFPCLHVPSLRTIAHLA